jgi:hypothetical protein
VIVHAEITIAYLTTTGFKRFAECLGHSAKRQKHSANALPSAALGKLDSAQAWPAKHALLSVKHWALGKAFAECQRRHTTKEDASGRNPNGRFAKCQPFDTRQRQVCNQIS